MKPIFKDRKIFLIGGSGGVGKTTVSAALGVQFATAGFKTLVLTVDPARRLAQALGFSAFTGEVQQVSIPNFPSAVLSATMLDVERDFDRVIARFAKSDAQREKILNSRLYRVMVDSLGGSHEYAAMERLLEVATEAKYDKIVVDTPPTQNAVDLFSAPQRLADFMDNSVLKWFQGKTPKYFQFFKQGTKLAMKALQSIFGSEFLSELGEILDDLEGMQAGFRTRNLEVIRLLQSQETAFVLVSYPSEIRYLESKSFLETLGKFQIPVSGLVLNRIEPYTPDQCPTTAKITPELRSALDPMLHYYSGLYEEQRKYVERFQELMKDLPLFLVARQHTPIHEVTALSHLGSFLVS